MSKVFRSLLQGPVSDIADEQIAWPQGMDPRITNLMHRGFHKRARPIIPKRVNAD